MRMWRSLEWQRSRAVKHPKALWDEPRASSEESDPPLSNGIIGGSRGLRLEARLRRHVNQRTGRRAGEYFEDVLVADAT
jgi:hypothetical protein